MCAFVCGEGGVLMLLSSVIVDYYLIYRWACFYESMRPSDKQKSV